MGESAATETSVWPGLIERPARSSGARSADAWPADIVAVFVHGAMDRSAGMAHLARQLRDAPTLRYDRRGYGRAVSLGTGGLVDHIDDLIRLVGERPVVLFGHSFGGLVVLGATATGRLDVRGVATWEAPTPWIPGWTGWQVEVPGDVDDPAAAIAERFMRSAVGTDRYESLPERTRAARRAEGPALIADMDPVLTAGVPFDPKRITVPCVLGVGGRPESPYLDGARWLASRIDDARVEIIDGAPHGAPMSRPADIARLVRMAADQVAAEVPDGDVVESSAEPDAYAF